MNKPCIYCDTPLVLGENWSEVGKRSRRYICLSCDNASSCVTNPLFNPKNNAISQVMHQRMLDLGLPRADHYNDEHADLRKRLRREINADGSWEKKPKKKKPTGRNFKPAQIKRVPPPRLVWTTAKQTRYATATCKIGRGNLGVTKGFHCELFPWVSYDECDASHILAQAVCWDKGHSEWIGDWENNMVLLFQPLNRAMEHGFWFNEWGQFCPPMGKDYTPWMFQMGVPNRRIKMTAGRRAFALMAVKESMKR